MLGQSNSNVIIISPRQCTAKNQIDFQIEKPVTRKSVIMRLEVQSAADFLMNMLRVPVTPSIKAMTDSQLLHFKGSLQTLLVLRYRSHWYPDAPNKGSGYRCIRINSKMDPIVAQAGRIVGCSTKVLSKMLPAELTMWVDPEEVSYRIGENGSICVLFDSSSRSSPSSDSDSMGSDELLLEQMNRTENHHILDLLENANFHSNSVNSQVNKSSSKRLDSSGSLDSSLRSPPPSSPFQLNTNTNTMHQQYNMMPHSPRHRNNTNTNFSDTQLYHWDAFTTNNSHHGTNSNNNNINNNKVRTQC